MRQVRILPIAYVRIRLQFSPFWRIIESMYLSLRAGKNVLFVYLSVWNQVYNFRFFHFARSRIFFGEFTMQILNANW